MHNPHGKLFILNLSVVIFGGAFLFWYYFVDGVYINRPIEYVNGVDPMSLEMVKHTYTVGDTPSYLTAFCKTREAYSTIEWTLVDGQKVGYGQEGPREIPVGCYPSAEGGKIVASTEKIPLYIEPTCEAHFVGVVRRILPGGRERTEYVQTQKFCVINDIKPLQDFFEEH